MRDDRIAGMNRTRNHWGKVVTSRKRFNASLAEKAFGASNFEMLRKTWTKKVMPFLSDMTQRDQLGATVDYGVHLYRIVEASWRAMAQGYLKERRWSRLGGVAPPTTIPFDPKALAEAIADYNAAWAGYPAFGLANVFAPSLYHPYYLCLGTSCNCAF